MVNQSDMKRIFALIVVMCCFMSSYADRTFSFGQISCYCPQTGQQLGGGAFMTVTFGDGYIITSGAGKFYAAQRNNDGSTTYLPASFAGTPGYQINAILVSADMQRIEERVTSTMGNMSLNMINTYTNAGEDGGRYAQGWANAQAVSKDRSRDRSSRGSGSCSRCKGTGVDPLMADYSLPGHRAKVKTAAYTKCKYCGKTLTYDHWHQRCIECSRN